MPDEGYVNDWREGVTQVQLLPDLCVCVNREFEIERLVKAYDLLCTHGRWWSRRMPMLGGMLEARCYDVAAEQVSQGMLYVEGFVLIPTRNYPLVIGHAWNVLRDRPGAVYDLTGYRMMDVPGSLYWGIVFADSFVTRHRESAGYNGILDGNIRDSSQSVYELDSSKWLFDY